jgi:hypothetical protein
LPTASFGREDLGIEIEMDEAEIGNGEDGTGLGFSSEGWGEEGNQE